MNDVVNKLLSAHNAELYLGLILDYIKDIKGTEEQLIEMENSADAYKGEPYILHYTLISAQDASDIHKIAKLANNMDVKYVDALTSGKYTSVEFRKIKYHIECPKLDYNLCLLRDGHIVGFGDGNLSSKPPICEEMWAIIVIDKYLPNTKDMLKYKVMKHNLSEYKEALERCINNSGLFENESKSVGVKRDKLKRNLFNWFTKEK